MRQATIKRTTAKPAAPKNRIEKPLTLSSYSPEEFHSKVQEVAYQLFEARGYVHGFDVEDWLAAEQIVRGS